MITKRPIKAKSTSRMLSILPPEFSMVTDKSSNGYKFINLLYGVEVDNSWENLESLYANSYLSSMDMSSTYSLYEVELSGIPNVSVLNGSGDATVGIKITDENEFYNGKPTRFIYKNTISIPSGTLQNPLGINYFRENLRCSGYILITTDTNQYDSYTAGESGVAFLVHIDALGNFDNVWSGYFPGIKTQDFDDTGVDEIISPINPYNFSGIYPLTRRVIDAQGQYHYIDHYEPYLGWTRDEVNKVVAVVDYSGQYYYNDDGNRTYYRTALNNPFGFDNYNTQYFKLKNVPISGTLKVFDLDILDISGNATEIPSTGKNVYYLKSPLMNMGNTTSGQFDPVYIGYDESVPSGRGFGNIEGSKASILTTTSWDYQYVGSKLNTDTRLWEEPSSGEYDALIKITNPHSRYIITYDWEEFSRASYISSLNANRYIHFDTKNPIYSIKTTDNNLTPVDYSFTKNPDYVDKDLGDLRSKIITFDGIKIRPNSQISKLDLTLPVEYVPLTNLDSFVTVNTSGKYIGFSDEFIPNVNRQRNYKIVTYFDANVVNGDAIENDRSGNNNLLYISANPSELYKINYGDYFGKKLINTDSDIFYYVNMTNKSFLKDNTYWAFGFNLRSINDECVLLDTEEDDVQVKIKLESDGRLYIEKNWYIFKTNVRINANGIPKELIVRNYPDDVSSAVPVFEAYVKEKGEVGFTKLDLVRTDPEIAGTSTGVNYMHIYKGCTIDIDYFKIYNEAYYGNY